MEVLQEKQSATLLIGDTSHSSVGDFNGLLIVSKIRRAIRYKVRLAKIAEYISSEYENHLNQHFSEEEGLLFCQLPHNDDLRMKGRRQHDHLKYLAWVCSNEPEVPGKLPEDFANRLEEHIQFEEKTLFPYIHQVMKAKNASIKLHESPSMFLS